MQGQYRGDFTRDTFNPLNHFRRVLNQQGRVDLDANWNEQAAILLHYLQSLAADLIGQHGGREDGFTVERLKLAGSTNFETGDFSILPGHYYVDGILCELEATPVSIVEATDPSGSKAVVRLDRSIADSIEFRENQYVAIWNDAVSPTKFTFARIESVDKQTGQIVTLTSKLSDFNLPSPLADTCKLRRLYTYRTQVDFPNSAELKGKASGTDFLVYLDVWERHLAHVEDNRMREVALGGADTATRAKIVWQVKTTDKMPTITKVSGKETVSDSDWRLYVSGNLQSENPGLLKARVRREEASTDPCITSPKSQYRGAENQLYRVEIHSGSVDADGKLIQPTFKWSRENGSVVFPISKSSGTAVTVESLGRDHRLGLKIGDYVEIVDDDYTLLGKADPLLQVVGIDRTMITLSGVPKVTVGQPTTRHPLVRRWDHQPGDSKQGGLTLQDGAAVIAKSTADDGWLNLEDGIQIQFQAPPSGAKYTYRTGDYWLIPARVATGDIEWPKLRDPAGKTALDAKGQPQSVATPPHGVEHHFAPLAIITVKNDQVSAPKNLRRTFT